MAGVGRGHSCRGQPTLLPGCALLCTALLAHLLPCPAVAVFAPPPQECVSYRSLNMMDESYMMEHVKEAVCYVAGDVRSELAHVARRGLKSSIRRDFVLPDGVHNLLGYVREPNAPAAAQPEQQAVPAGSGAVAAGAGQAGGAPRRAGPGDAAGASSGGAGGLPQEQVLVLNNERFMVPELLFHPSDIGLQQAGVAEVLVQSVSSCHAALQPLLYSNILLTGGSARFPGFYDRFVAELRPLVPDGVDIHVTLPDQPELTAWRGLSLAVPSGEYAQRAVTKAQYEEQGIGLRRY